MKSKTHNPGDSRRRKGRFQKPNQLKSLNLTEVQDSRSPQSIQTFFCDPFLMKRIENMRTKTRIEAAKQGIKNLYGRRNPIDYQPEFGFEESWQNTALLNDPKEYKPQKNQSIFLSILQWIQVLVYCLTLWFLSVYRVFKVGQNLGGGILAMSLFAVYGMVVKQWVSSNSDQQLQISLPYRKIIKRQWFFVLFLLYLGLLLVEIHVQIEEALYLLFLDIFFMAKIYMMMKKVYLKLRIKLLSSSWRNEIEIFQLVAGCLSLVHLFSIILMLASLTDSNLNWTQNIQTFNQSFINRYIYSLYFACTTMFTVGYGDLTPKNKWEILTILLVQVVGIINIGYVINEVGRFVSKINENQDKLYRNISDAQKFTENYQLPQDLSSKMRTYLVSNQIATRRFNVEEEDELMKKLNEQTREEVINHNRLELIKKSVFFLCHWSKRFQKNVAMKLERNVYSPGDMLIQNYGHERIYILERGKINIEPILHSKGRALPYLRQKVLKTLEISPTRGVQFNVYGYSALISGLNINLKALAQDYSICYSISKQNFIAALGQNSQDSEYFHEVRSKIEESYCKEAWQAPKINHPREHYIPLLFFIIKKEREKGKVKQSRKYFVRQFRIRFKVIQAEIAISEQEIEKSEGGNKKKKTIRFSIQGIIKKKETKDTLNSEKSVFLRKTSSNFGSSDRLVKSIADLQEERGLSSSEELVLLVDFESSKSYQHFRPKFNPDTRISKYNSKFSKSQENSTCSLTALSGFPLIGLDSIGEEAKIKIMKSRVFS